jgi:hypothetical protein
MPTGDVDASIYVLVQGLRTGRNSL